MDFGRMQRLLENESINGTSAYGLYDMMKDLRKGLFSELVLARKLTFTEVIYNAPILSVWNLL